MSNGSLENRVEALEAEISRLKRLVEEGKTAPGWKRMVGAFLNDPYFKQAMDYGRQYRESLRPGKKKAKK